MTEFKVGDKVIHRSFGAGVIRFGPYMDSLRETAYLLEVANGVHRRVDADALTKENTYQVDAVAKAIAESDGNPWDDEYDDKEMYRKNARAVLEVLKERGDLADEKDRPLKVGDRVRVLEDDPDVRHGEFVGKVGVLRDVGRLRSAPYLVEFDADQYAPHPLWNCARVERV
jgi:hypothetical protein